MLYKHILLRGAERGRGFAESTISILHPYICFAFVIVIVTCYWQGAGCTLFVVALVFGLLVSYPLLRIASPAVLGCSRVAPT